VSRKLRLLQSYWKGLPIWCSWQVTPRCASLCAFCEHRTEGAFEEADLATIRHIGEELGASGSLMVSLSGGDPLLRDDLPLIVAALARHHFPLVTTHGWHVTEEKARSLWAAGLEAATVTLDYHEEARQDAAAGQTGAHARAVRALAAFAATRTRPSQQVNVKTRLQRDTLAGLPDLLALAAVHGASVTVEPTFPLPNASERGAAGRTVESSRRSDEEPGELPQAELRARLRELRARHSNFRIGAFFLDRMEQALGEGVPGCQAGRSFFNVDHRGRVSKCLEFRRPEDRAGDLSSEAWREVLPRLRRFHEGNDCRACWMSSRGEVESLYTVRGLLGALPSLVRA
jgi:MoaA/NifB/PqqE/SkfB family radical SAM enzyme